LGRLVRNLADWDTLRNVNRFITAYRLAPEFDCPCCGHRGKFDAAGDTLQFNSECPRCHAVERHRLLALAMKSGFVSARGKAVLHFAPEAAIAKLVDAQRPLSYRTADLKPGRADLVLDIADLDLADGSLDLVICSHVLEHVDDRAALREIRRVLRPGGEAILMIPIAEGWKETFEDDSINSKEGRHRFFAQWDHVRYYGADFRDRVRAAGFDLFEFSADGPQCAQMGIMRGEIVFRAVRAG
jgi:SAM-dependent methyltransferase